MADNEAEGFFKHLLPEALQTALVHTELSELLEQYLLQRLIVVVF